MSTMPLNLLSQLAPQGVAKNGTSANKAEVVTNLVGAEVQNSGENFDILLANLLPEGQSEEFINSANFGTQTPAENSGEKKAEVLLNQINQKAAPKGDMATLEVLKQLKSQNPEATNLDLEKMLNEATVATVATSSSEVSSKDILKNLLDDAKMAKSEATTKTKELFSLFKNDSSASGNLLLEGETINTNAQNSSEEILGKTNEKSKIGLSGDDFLATLKNQKQLKNELQSQKTIEADKSSPLAFLKDYTSKQNILNNNVIKNTHDLAFKEGLSKASKDELVMPEMKIGAELSTIKESFIPMTNAQNNSQQQDPNVGMKTLDLSRLNTTNPNAIINEISNYIQQSQFANMETIDLVVRHDDLGHFNIQVNRNVDAKNDMIGLQITTTTQEGHEFFSKNEMNLLKNLSQAGVQLAELKIVSGNEAMGFAQSDSKNSNQSFNGQGQQQRGETMNMSQNSSHDGSQRRRELWEEARQNSFRYGA